MSHGRSSRSWGRTAAATGWPSWRATIIRSRPTMSRRSDRFGWTRSGRTICLHRRDFALTAYEGYEMRTSKRRLVALISVCALVLLGPRVAFAQSTFPDRYITVIVPLSPGGGADLTLNFFKDKVGSILGQPLVINHKPGAAGAIGTNFVAKAKPDGYTLLLANKGGLISTPLTMKDAGYTMADLVPICLLTRSPSIFYVRDDSPY